MIALAKAQPRPMRRDNFQDWAPTPARRRSAKRSRRETATHQYRSHPESEMTMLLNDRQWQAISELPEVGRPHRVGRRPTDDRQVIEAILWVIKSRARWRDLPPTYPSPRTCQRRLRRWQKKGVWTTIWHSYITSLDEESQEEWGRVFLEIGLEEGAVDDDNLVQVDEHRIGRPPFWYSMAQDFWSSRWATSPIEPDALIDRWAEAINEGLDHNQLDGTAQS
jgi:transposase